MAPMCRDFRGRSFDVMNRNLTSLAGAALCVAALVPATASAKSTTLRFFDKPTDIVMTQADGTVIDQAPYPDIAAGDTLDIFSLDFVGNHKKHAKKATASSHTRCVFAQGTQGPPACDADVAIDGALLYFTGDTLTRGTGVFRGATGTATSKTVSDEDNSSDIVVKLKLK
jgi:hypothetical protein